MERKSDANISKPKSRIYFNCQYCSKITWQPPRVYAKSDNHFCSGLHFALWTKLQKQNKIFAEMAKGKTQKAIVWLTPDQKKLLESCGTVFGDNWYHIPYWFKKIEGGSYEMVLNEDLPDEIKDFLLWGPKNSTGSNGDQKI